MRIGLPWGMYMQWHHMVYFGTIWFINAQYWLSVVRMLEKSYGGEAKLRNGRELWYIIENVMMGKPVVRNGQTQIHMMITVESLAAGAFNCIQWQTVRCDYWSMHCVYFLKQEYNAWIDKIGPLDTLKLAKWSMPSICWKSMTKAWICSRISQYSEM